MKYLDEYRDAAAAEKLAAAIARTVTRPWTIMEVCGGQTHTIVKYGIDELLPPEVELVHGPGCPVCVTSLEMIDRAHAIASRPDVIFCSFGDMLRVPGSRGDLLQLKSQGSDVRVVYSPLDAVNLAARRPGPTGRVLRHRLRDDGAAQRDGGLDGAQAAADELQRAGVARAGAADRSPRSCRRRATACRGFLGPGHVCTVMGYEEYEPIASAVPRADRHHRFRADRHARRRAADGAAAGGGPAPRSRTSIARAVRREGNPESRALIEDVFEVCDRKWRGVGLIPKSGYQAALRVPRPRRRAAVRGGRHRDAGIDRVHQRAGAPRAEEAARLPGVRQALHAADAAGGDDGVVRRGVCRLLTPTAGIWKRVSPRGRGRLRNRNLCNLNHCRTVDKREVHTAESRRTGTPIERGNKEMLKL